MTHRNQYPYSVRVWSPVTNGTYAMTRYEFTQLGLHHFYVRYVGRGANGTTVQVGIEWWR